MGRLGGDRDPGRSSGHRVRWCDADDDNDGLSDFIEALRHTDVVYWIEAQRAVVAGDVLLVDDGQLCLCPQTWLGGKTHAHLAETLAPLLELPVEIVVTSHSGNNRS